MEWKTPGSGLDLGPSLTLAESSLRARGTPELRETQIVNVTEVEPFRGCERGGSRAGSPRRRGLPDGSGHAVRCRRKKPTVRFHAWAAAASL